MFSKRKPRRSSVPFQERNSPLRGALDLLTLRYPPFLFRLPLSSATLPVFHFHEASPTALEPYFRHLAENGWKTVLSDSIEALVTRGIHPGPRTVALTFDDAWSSFWFTVPPLLEKYDLRAIVYVSPARVPLSEAPPRVRPADGILPADIDRTSPLFCTWSELRELHVGGRVDIQAHSLRHAKICAAPEPADYLFPDLAMHPHDVPLLSTPNGERPAAASDWGAPLYPARSRLSDAFQWRRPAAFSACTEYVRAAGGAEFFRRPRWREELARVEAAAAPGSWESRDERRMAIREELVQSRDILQARLGKSIRQMCFPWAVSGRVAREEAARVPFATAFSDRLHGRRVVAAGDSPLQLMRLKHAYIFCLPGRPRTWFFGRKPAPASAGLRLGPAPLS